MDNSVTPRTLVFDDVKSIKYFLGIESEKTLEREFYERLVNRPFVKNSNNPPKWQLCVFTNARYIYYLIRCEEDYPSQCFNIYLGLAAEGAKESEIKHNVTAATMALVYNWICIKLQENQSGYYFDKNTEADIQELKKIIYLHFCNESNTVTAESKSDFFDLIIDVDKCNYPSNIEELCGDVRMIEDAAMNAPIQDVAIGIDYLREFFDYDSKEEKTFLSDIIERIKDEGQNADNPQIIDDAVSKIDRRIKYLKTHPKSYQSSPNLSYDNYVCIPLQEENAIPPEWEKNLGWIFDRNKAPIILKTVRQYMCGKTKPKDVLVPLCAALEARLIRKPTMQEYHLVFEQYPIKSQDSLDSWISSMGANKYKRSSNYKELYKDLLEKFMEIGES